MSRIITSAFFLFDSNACARRSFSAGLEYVDFGTLGIYRYTRVQRVKISGTKCTITTVAAFHTELKLAKAEMRNHLLNTSPWATLPYKVVDEEWCRPTKRNHNKWNTTAFTTAIRSATKEYHP